MEFSEVKEYINGHQEDQEVKAFIDSLADKRVTGALETARKKWEAELPARINEEVEKRRLKEAEELRLQAEAENLLQEAGIDKDLGLSLLGNLSGLDENTRAERIKAAIEQGSAITNRLKQEIYGNNPPPKSGDYEGPKAMGDMSSEEILQNLHLFQEA